MPAPSLCLIGEGYLLQACAKKIIADKIVITCVYTTDRESHHFFMKQGIPCVTTFRQWSAYLQQHPCDYGLSINNLIIIPKTILNLTKKGFINYHNGPLPAMRGLNTPAWRIYNKHKEHAITWHQVDPSIDTGDILYQHSIAIAPNDTEMSLQMRCVEETIKSMPLLLNALKKGCLTPAAQTGDSHYYSKNNTLHFESLITIDMPFEAISNIMRTLYFGHYNNTLGLPKLLLGDTILYPQHVKKAPVTDAAPGETHIIDDDTLQLQTLTESIIFKGFKEKLPQALTSHTLTLLADDAIKQLRMYISQAIKTEQIIHRHIKNSQKNQHATTTVTTNFSTLPKACHPLFLASFDVPTELMCTLPTNAILLRCAHFRMPCFEHVRFEP
jgi:methionyl-tRNA formyltransferase